MNDPGARETTRSAADAPDHSREGRGQVDTPASSPASAEPAELHVARDPRTRSILNMQRTLGNAHVQRYVAEHIRARSLSVQRDDGDTSSGPSASSNAGGSSSFGGVTLQLPAFGSPPPPANPYQLHLDPDIEAQIRAMEMLGQIIAPEPVTSALVGLPLPPIPASVLAPGPTGGQPGGTAPAPGGGSSSSSSSGSPGPAPGTELQGPAPGSFGDAWRAAMSDPIVGGAITSLGDQVRSRAQSDWHSLSTGGQAAVVTTSVVIAGGALAGVLTNPGARDWFEQTISGHVIPVPGVPGLGAQLNLGGPNVIIGLHFDLGLVLPSVLGFGAGAPPTAL